MNKLSSSKKIDWVKYRAEVAKELLLLAYTKSCYVYQDDIERIVNYADMLITQLEKPQSQKK